MSARCLRMGAIAMRPWSECRVRLDRLGGRPLRARSLAAIAVIAIGGYFALRSVAIDEAERDTRERVMLEGRLVETALTDGVLTGDPKALAQLDDLVQDADPRRVGRAREAVDARTGGSSTPTSRALIGRAVRARARRSRSCSRPAARTPS